MTGTDPTLFDGEDVDADGPPAPDGSTLTMREIDAVRAARADADRDGST